MNFSGGRGKELSEKVAKELSKNTGFDFLIDWFPEPSPHWACFRKHPKYPVRASDGKELGLMFIEAELRHVYFDARRKIKWPDDWIDPYPPCIDRIDFFNDYVEIQNSDELKLYFMSEAYYYREYDSWGESDIRDFMKVARFIPAVVKDLNIFIKLVDKTCDEYEIDKHEFQIKNFHYLSYCLSFKIKDMDDEDIIENLLKRVKALTELRKKFKEWLPNERRKEYYESTMLYPDDPFREKEVSDTIFKWPLVSENEEKRKKYERYVKYRLWISTAGRYYDLDGCRLRLAKKTEKGLKYLGRMKRKGWIVVSETEVKKEDLYRDDIVVTVDERLEKLPKLPLEKIEFLKEDFPEMFKE